MFCVVLLQSCINSTSAGFQINEEEEIKGRPLHVIDTTLFRYPFRVRQKDSTLYVLDLHARNHYCFRLSYPNLKFEESFASKGNGPEEFLSVENIRLNNRGMVYLLDANKEAISIYSLKEDSVLKKVKLPKELMRSLDFALLNDSLFAVTDYTGKYRIHIVDDNGNIQQQLFRIPTKKEKDSNISDVALAQAWRSFIDYNPNNKILAIATQLGQVIEIYDLKTNKIINILYGKFGEPKFAYQGGNAIPNGIMGYSDIHVGNDAIYTIFWGTSFKDIQKDPFNIPQGGNIIQVFSLEGKPLKQYILDRYITGFSINENNGKLIGLDVNNEQQLIEYQL